MEWPKYTLLLLSTLFTATLALPTSSCGCTEPSALSGPLLLSHAEVAATSSLAAEETCSSSCSDLGLNNFLVVVQSLKTEEDANHEEPWRWDCRCLHSSLELTECNQQRNVQVACRSKDATNGKDVDKELKVVSLQTNLSNGPKDNTDKEATFGLLALILCVLSIGALAILALKTWCQHRRDRGEASPMPELATISGLETLRPPVVNVSNNKHRGRLLSLSHFSVYEKK